VEVKMNVNTDNADQRSRHRLSMNLLINFLKNSGKKWAPERIIHHVEMQIKKIEDAEEVGLLKDFVAKVHEDQDFQNTLANCGPQMYELIISVEEKYHSRFIITDGSVCFNICFDEDQDLQKFVTDLQEGNSDFKKDVSRILLDRQYLSVFQVNPEGVTWKATDVKVYKGLNNLSNSLEPCTSKTLFLIKFCRFPTCLLL
jgi:hypothetical protein